MSNPFEMSTSDFVCGESPWLRFCKCSCCGSPSWDRNSDFYSCGTAKRGKTIYTLKDEPSWKSWIPFWRPDLITTFTAPEQSSYCKDLEFAKKVEAANKMLQSEKAKA
jgi:hypothetical protein